MLPSLSGCILMSAIVFSFAFYSVLFCELTHEQTAEIISLNVEMRGLKAQEVTDCAEVVQ